MKVELCYIENLSSVFESFIYPLLSTMDTLLNCDSGEFLFKVVLFSNMFEDDHDR